MSTVTIYEYNFPTKIYFGAGSVARLPDALKAASLARPLW